MTTFRIVLFAMTAITVVLIAIAVTMEYNFLKTGKFALRNPFKRKPKQELSFFDKLVDLIGSDAIEVYNGVTYSCTRIARTGDEEPIKFGTDEWFKIKIGKFVSGHGDWSGGFSHACCAVAEVYVSTDGRVLHVCACHPYYNSPTKEADEKLHEKVQFEVDKFKLHLSCHDNVWLETNDQWLRGVLDTIHRVTFIGEADLWKHGIAIERKLNRN